MEVAALVEVAGSGLLQQRSQIFIFNYVYEYVHEGVTHKMGLQSILTSCLFISKDRVSLCKCSGCPETLSVDQVLFWP